MIIPVLICGVFFTSCGSEKASEEDTSLNSKGLNLWWNLEFSGEHGRGRGYVFAFSEVERSEVLYDLKFEYQIDNIQKSIVITLIDKINKGKCPNLGYEWGSDDGLCNSSGILFIPENLINEDKYKFIVKTANFTVQSEFIITEEKAMLNIPENNYISVTHEYIDVIPKNILYGSIAFAGEQNKVFASDFLEAVRALGFTIVTLRPHPQLPMINVDETGNFAIIYLPPENFIIPFMFSMTSKFSIVFELAQVHFNKSEIDINFFCTNGDKANLSNINGISVFYAE